MSARLEWPFGRGGKRGTAVPCATPLLEGRGRRNPSAKCILRDGAKAPSPRENAVPRAAGALQIVRDNTSSRIPVARCQAGKPDPWSLLHSPCRRDARITTKATSSSWWCRFQPANVGVRLESLTYTPITETSLTCCPPCVRPYTPEPYGRISCIHSSRWFHQD